MKTVKNAWIFDVDGVITDIKKEIITKPFISDFIIKILEKCEPVALNTGRGIDWAQEIVLVPLKNKITNLNILRNLFVVAENGGITVTFNQDGSLKKMIDGSLKMPDNLDKDVQELVQTKYSQSMRYEDKETMITTKIREGYSVEKYRIAQRKIIKDLQKLIDSHDFTNKLKVDISTIGTSIMNKNAGKDKGIELILSWLLKKDIKPQRFITFGDSESDIPMAEKLNERGLSVEFVYAGKEDLPKQNYPFKVTKTKKLYTQGVVEFIGSL